MCEEFMKDDDKQDEIREKRRVGNQEILKHIGEDKKRKAQGDYVLLWWVQSLVNRGTILRNHPCKLPELIRVYLNSVKPFLVSDRVIIRKNNSIVMVMPSVIFGCTPREGMILLEARESHDSNCLITTNTLVTV